MKLYLARHTQSNYNVQGLLNSNPAVNVHLTEEGLRQAEELARALQSIKIDVNFVSEFPRVQQTIAIINQQHDRPVIIDKRLNENRSGFENGSVREWRATIGKTPNMWTAVCNDGESLADAAARAANFLDDLRQMDYAAVLVVTHGWITKSIYRVLGNLSFEEADQFDLTQGTFTEFEL